MLEVKSSNILIVNSITETLSDVLKTLPAHSIRVIRNEEKDDFLLAQAKEVLKEAYIASNSVKYIILCGKTFRHEAQNSLLKILEEPPKNVVFIIITTSKSTILPTILSRMPHKYLKTSLIKVQSELDILNLDLKEVYSFLKDNQKIGKNDAKSLIEGILFKANAQKIKFNQKELELFSKSIKLLDLNSRAINVLSTLLLSLLQRKR